MSNPFGFCVTAYFLWQNKLIASRFLPQLSLIYQYGPNFVEMMHGFWICCNNNKTANVFHSTEVDRISPFHVFNLLQYCFSFFLFCMYVSAFYSNWRQPDDASITFFKRDCPFFGHISLKRGNTAIHNIFFCFWPLEYCSFLCFVSSIVYNLQPVKTESSTFWFCNRILSRVCLYLYFSIKIIRFFP